MIVDIYLDRIKPLFEHSGITDKELEKNLHLPRGVIYKWGTGKYKSYKTYIPQIATYFHVSTDYLLGNTDDPAPVGQKEGPTPVSESGLSGKEEQLISLFRLVPEERQDAILQAIEITLRSQGLL